MEFIGRIEDDDKLLQEDQLVIYGAGTIGRRLVSALDAKGCKKKIVAFCDGNQKMWGKKELDIPILSLKETRKLYPNAAYLIGSCCVRQIAETLIKNEVSKIHITRN